MMSSVIFLDELANFRLYDLTIFQTADNAVMPHRRRGVVLAPRRRNTGAQRMRGFGLAAAGNIVQFAFDGEERRVLDGLGPDSFARHIENAAREALLLEYANDGVQVILGRQIHHGVVLVIETAMRF